MSFLGSQERSLIVKYLRAVAPYSVIDTGMAHARNGHVTECVRLTNKIQGVVLESEDRSYSAIVEVISSRDIAASCSCSTQDQMQEQWCAHAVALLWRAAELGFLKANAGFADAEAVYQITSNIGQEVAAVIRSTAEARGAVLGTGHAPHVRVAIKPDRKRVGLQLFFDGDPFVPTIFESGVPRSRRTLDTLLAAEISESGMWDEDSGFWYVSGSADIEKLFGLLQEYDDVVIAGGEKKIAFASQMLDAQLTLTWREEGPLELAMHWVLPSGEQLPKREEPLGTGPFWILLDGCVYRIAPEAARIASLFPDHEPRQLKREQTGQILEAIEAGEFDPRRVRICNAELQPESEVRSPVPLLEVEKVDEDDQAFNPFSVFEVEALLDFEYAPPPAGKNIVYLPDRALEREQTALLRSIGFEFSVERQRFVARGDAALDLVSQGRKKLPPRWKVRGLEEIQRATRFSSLSLTISLADKSADGGEGLTSSATVDCSISLTQNNAALPLSVLFKGEGSFSERWIELDDGAFARVPGGSLATLKMALGAIDANFALSSSIRQLITPLQAIGLARLACADVRVISDRKLKALTRRIDDFKGIKPVRPSRNFRGKLRHYQEEGLGWLCFLHKFELAGILADEMGLGKTVQTLALLQYLADKAGPGKLSPPALVIAPTSVITNWYYEAERFAPRLRVLLLHGPDRKRSFDKLAEHDLLISSYALLRIDRYELARAEFSYLILDEAQNIKNPDASTTKAAKHLKARHRLALTGTPAENRPLELWSIMDFLLPGYLGNHDFFKQQLEKPIAEAGSDTSLQMLKTKIKPFILRREKRDVEKDLPPKIESVLYVDMTPHQQELYQRVLDEVRPQVFSEVTKRGVRGATVSILAALMRLRQICNHPNSIRGLRDAENLGSGKFNLLRDLTEEALQSGKKILLFSQFRGMLAIIREWLDQREYRYLYLDGMTKERAPLIDRFNNDPDVRLFLISLKAGGTGLNLTAADTVILYDPWWNPAVENQAVDRAHRIGQTKTVNVYRLVTDHSVEQKIMKLKEKKSKMVEAIINEDRLTTLNLTKEDLENLFGPDTAVRG